MQQECCAELFHEARAVVGRRAVHTEANGYAELKHLRDARNAGRKLHIGNRAVAYAGSGIRQEIQFLVIKMNSVRVPHVRAHPAERLHERKRPHALAI